jgi:hypothetical protein
MARNEIAWKGMQRKINARHGIEWKDIERKDMERCDMAWHDMERKGMVMDMTWKGKGMERKGMDIWKDKACHGKRHGMAWQGKAWHGKA